MIKRYNIDYDMDEIESEDGKWVKWKDVEKLLDQIRKLEFELMITIPDPYCE
jgi:hypothetical protein